MFSDMRYYLMTAIFCCFALIPSYGQLNYPDGNSAYNAADSNGYSNVSIAAGNFIYSWDQNNKQYRYQNYILIPDLTSTPNGNYIHADSLFGFGNSSSPSDTNFQWDNEQMIQASIFDEAPVFVSPASEQSMTYLEAMQNNGSFCGSQNCTVVIDSPRNTLLYPNHPPFEGTYEMWDGEELVNAGDLKGTGTDSKHSQQQLNATGNMSYCVATYGEGWRIPTDIEMGHYNDNTGSGNGFDQGYQGTSASDYIWSSSLFKIYDVKRWPVRLSDGEWENCAGFLYVHNKVRCIYSGIKNDSLTNSSARNNFDIQISPNPSHGYFTITGNIKLPAKINIFNAKGKEIIYKNMTNKKIKINTGNHKGIFFLKLTDKTDKYIIKKIVLL